MTDAQMVTLAVAILAVFAGTLFNNSRIGDMNSRIGQQMRHMKGNIMSVVISGK
jgi:hypothetical protein